jgi:hypothetical protein
MAIKVFISHSSLDTWVARQIATQVRALGAEAFLDEADVSSGDDFLERILNAEAECSELLVLLTPWGMSRPWVLFEISCFRHSRKRIVGVTHGLTTNEVVGDPYLGVLVDRRVLVDINRLPAYFQELGVRIKVDAEGVSDA